MKTFNKLCVRVCVCMFTECTAHALYVAIPKERGSDQNTGLTSVFPGSEVPLSEELRLWPLFSSAKETNNSICLCITNITITQAQDLLIALYFTVFHCIVVKCLIRSIPNCHQHQLMLMLGVWWDWGQWQNQWKPTFQNSKYTYCQVLKLTETTNTAI